MPKLYTKATWVDEVLSDDERYDIADDGGTPIESNVQINLATAVAQAGTALDAAKMNNVEDGLDALDTLLAGRAPLSPYRLVPSVSSNNLTLALKDLDGNNFSATNPGYFKIGNAIRTVTGALSVTINAGTNWGNAGSAELATLEIDWFAYLGYNATDGVVFGLSRIPYANLYSDFSATSTNEKYAAISTITNAAAGDEYVNIGRFAATLSAGAGYTWTVPTFTADNLIHRPVYETRILAWTPTPSGFSSNPAGIYHYQVVGRNAALFIREFTSGTSNATTFTETAPFSAMTLTSGLWVGGALLAIDNTAAATGVSYIATGSNSIVHAKGGVAAGWTSSGEKRATGVTLTYPLA
jgi:hypothetical protein